MDMGKYWRLQSTLVLKGAAPKIDLDFTLDFGILHAAVTLSLLIMTQEAFVDSVD